MAKKGEISLTVVIIAILALIVLAVLVFILINNSRNFNEGTSSCQEKGGECRPENNCKQISDQKDVPYFAISAAECSSKQPKQICCVPLGEAKKS